MDDREILGVFVLGIGILLFLVPFFLGVFLLILPAILIIIGIIVILNKNEDKIEERKDKKSLNK